MKSRRLPPSEGVDELRTIQETLGDTFTEVSPKVYRSGKIIIMYSPIIESWVLQTDSKIFKNQVKYFSSLQTLIVGYIKILGEKDVENEEIQE